MAIYLNGKKPKSKQVKNNKEINRFFQEDKQEEFSVIADLEPIVHSL